MVLISIYLFYSLNYFIPQVQVLVALVPVVQAQVAQAQVVLVQVVQAAQVPVALAAQVQVVPVQVSKNMAYVILEI